MLRISVLLLVLGLILPSMARADNFPFNHKDTVALMEKVCDWQWSALDAKKSDKKVALDDWIRATFYMGDMALYRATSESRYLDQMTSKCDSFHWEPGKKFRHADYEAIGQTYAEIFAIKKDPAMIAPMEKRWDAIMAQPMAGHLDWWWEDALFMAPPALARLSADTGDMKYLDFMDKQYWDSADFLFDKSEHLMFRDKSFFDKKEANGQKVFWARGNGWVVAGLARILQKMPANYPSRPKYVALLTDMCTRLAELQQPDGFWRASLLDPKAYPEGESSGTGLICYAMAWGVKEGILPRDKFLPVVVKAWIALAGAVEPSGKLDWVQAVGSHPAPLKKDDTAEYGVGAFLMAGCDIVEIADKAAENH